MSKMGQELIAALQEALDDAEGKIELNEKLAQTRADAVKNLLIKKYKISADRIVSEGQGIGNMFSESSWNRVSICTLDEAK